MKMSTSSVADRLKIERRAHRAADGVAFDDAVGLHLIDRSDGVLDVHAFIRLANSLPAIGFDSKFIAIRCRHFPPGFDEEAIRRFVVGAFGQFGFGQGAFEVAVMRMSSYEFRVSNGHWSCPRAVLRDATVIATG